MTKTDAYYEKLDQELTENLPEIDFARPGSLETVYSNLVVLSSSDMALARSLAEQKHLTVNELLSSTLRQQLAV